jgi:hypothetical protein
MLGVVAAQIHLCATLLMQINIAQSQKNWDSGFGERLYNLPLRATTSERRARTIIDDTVALEVFD